MTAPPKHGVVLSSGGADGAYAVGVLKALVTGRVPGVPHVFDPIAYSGTSIGALCSACIVGNPASPADAVANLERIWLEELAGQKSSFGNGAFRIRGNPVQYLAPPPSRSPLKGADNFLEDVTSLGADFVTRATTLVASNEPLLQRMARLVSFSSFISNSPLRDTIERNVSFETVRASRVSLAINSTDTKGGRLKTFYNRNMTDEKGADIVLSSAAIPGFFPPIDLSDAIFIDGAVLAYTKLSPAINAGAELLHVVHVDPDLCDVAVTKPESTLDTLYRMFVVGWASRLTRGMRDLKRINEHVEFLQGFAADVGLTGAEREKLFSALLPPGSFKRDPSGTPTTDPLRIGLHRYFPRNGGFEPLGLLNLSRPRIEELIAEGYEDTMAHDCERCGCVLPQR